GLETVPAKEVKPVLNIKHKQFTMQIENNIIVLLGKPPLPITLFSKIISADTTPFPKWVILKSAMK
ncbi:MAG: hypothetical protein IJE72_04685, partial [Clostridia bacterium]|nr:hypothetical protein [Clostridia bacterium]